MQVDDKIAHMGVVHGAMRGFLPRVIGLRVVGVDADDIERREVAKLGSVERFEFAAENEMQQLPAAFLGILCGHAAPSPACRKSQRSTRLVRSIRSGCSALPLVTRLGKRGDGRLYWCAPPR